MADKNEIILRGTLKKPELQERGAHKFFKFKVQTDPTGDAFPVGVSCYVTDEDLQLYDLKRNSFPKYVIVAGSNDAAVLKGDEYKFYDLSAYLDNVHFTDNEVSPVNQAMFSGKITEVEEEDDTGSMWFFMSTSYYSRKDSTWKERVVRCRMEMAKAQAAGVATDAKVFVTGLVAEKFGDEFLHHVEVETMVPRKD